MEREANYAAVGAFVLLVGLLGALFVYWYSDTREHRDYNRYEVYFEGSVSGLERGAAVRYLGGGGGRGTGADQRRLGRGGGVVPAEGDTAGSGAPAADLDELTA